MAAPNRNSKENTCVLVTGAAGFIGSHLVDRLLDRGCYVIGVDNLSLGKMSHLEGARKNRNFKFVEEDLLNTEQCLSKVRQHLGDTGYTISAVWHLAANSDIMAGVANPDVDLNNTFLTTYRTLAMMKALGIGQILFASSSAIYGDHRQALREDSGPLFPISNYGAMKLASEGIISAAVESYLESAWIFRFPNVVGGRATHGVIYDFVKRLTENPHELRVLGDGTQQKPYLHVHELIDAMLFAFEHSRDRLNCFNIGQVKTSTNVRYIAEHVVRCCAPSAKVVYGTGAKGWVGDVPRFEFSIDKIRALGWSARQTSDQAIDQAIAEIVRDFEIRT